MKLLTFYYSSFAGTIAFIISLNSFAIISYKNGKVFVIYTTKSYFNHNFKDIGLIVCIICLLIFVIEAYLIYLLVIAFRDLNYADFYRGIVHPESLVIMNIFFSIFGYLFTLLKKSILNTVDIVIFVYGSYTLFSINEAALGLFKFAIVIASFHVITVAAKVRKRDCYS